jgi:hypothetical protein
MKLVISKAQNKGLMGGVSFQIKAAVQLSAEELKLVQHYKLENEMLLAKKLVNIWGQPTDTEIKVLVRHLISGESYKCKDLGEVISYTESLKDACSKLKGYIDVARGFEGEEVYDV